jgi:UDP-glucose 4-epimerase
VRALVTGGTGFIGSHLVDLLVADGHHVVVLDTAATHGDLLPDGVEVRLGDVRDATAVRAAARGADLVFHLAARTDLAGTDLADYDVNLIGTQVVAAAAREAGAKRLVFFSSMLAVGLTGEREPIDETSTLATQSHYGESKRRGEEIVRTSGAPFAIVRPTLVYGPRERATMHALLRAIHGHRFMLIGPDVLQAFAYVGNVARAAYEAALHPGAVGGTFFVSDARPYTLAEFSNALASAVGVRLPPIRLPLTLALAAGVTFDLLARLVGHELILSSRRVHTMTTHYVYSIDRSREAFGFTPPYALEQAVADTARWYLERNLL